MLEGLIFYRKKFNTSTYNKNSYRLINFKNGILLVPKSEKDAHSSISFRLFDFNTSTLLYDKVGSEISSISISVNNINNTVEISRDSFGTIPLYFTFKPNEYLFYSNSFASVYLFVKNHAIATVNDETVKKYSIFGNDSREIYQEDTFFNEIKAVLPGHKASFTSVKYQQTPKLNFSNNQFLNIPDQEYYDLFQEKFKNSIRNRTGDFTTKVASQLSGGLDSSSICSVFNNIYPERELITLHINAETVASDEVHYANIIANTIKSKHLEVKSSKNYVENLTLLISKIGHPTRMLFGGNFHSTMMEAAITHGATIMLNGHPGDSIVGTGFSLISIALQNKNWDEAKLLLNEHALNFNHQSWAGVNWELMKVSEKIRLVENKFIIKHLAEINKNSTSLQFVSYLIEFYKNSSFSSYNFLVEGINILRRKLDSPDLTSFLKINLKTILPQLQKINIFELNSNWSTGIFSTQSIGFNEEMYILGAHYGIKNEYPFFDEDLYSLSLNTPLRIKFDNGRGRGQLRHAMKNIVPQEVINRVDKSKYGIYSNIVALDTYQQARDFLTSNSMVWQYIDISKFNQAITQLRQNIDKNSPYPILIIRTIALAIWLHIIDNNNMFSEFQTNYIELS